LHDAFNEERASIYGTPLFSAEGKTKKKKRDEKQKSVIKIFMTLRMARERDCERAGRGRRAVGKWRRRRRRRRSCRHLSGPTGRWLDAGPAVEKTHGGKLGPGVGAGSYIANLF
jgi:hypothetical protein